MDSLALTFAENVVVLAAQTQLPDFSDEYDPEGKN